jgi:hypothetical protein
MTNERERWGDVRWLDERALHEATLAGDPEAFAEVMRRYDPVVRYKIWRVLGGSRLLASDALDGQIAEFWCSLIADGMATLQKWDPEGGELFAPWLGNLALHAGGEKLRQLLRERAMEAA